jgi:hypothetical protein
MTCDIISAKFGRVAVCRTKRDLHEAIVVFHGKSANFGYVSLDTGLRQEYEIARDVWKRSERRLRFSLAGATGTMLIGALTVPPLGWLIGGGAFLAALAANPKDRYLDLYSQDNAPFIYAGSCKNAWRDDEGRTIIELRESAFYMQIKREKFG